MHWVEKNKQKKAERLRREEQLWLWIGFINLSRTAPREMIGSQNLSRVPDWMLHYIRNMVDLRQDVIMKFDEDLEYEYRFKPRIEYVPNSFLVDICRRPRHWKKLL